MNDLDAARAKSIARGDAAQQHAASSARGPHPLPLFLDHARQAIGADRARMERFLGALAAYQNARWRRDLPDMPVVASSGSAVLRDYGGSGRPAVFVPSLINTADVLDLTAQRSLLRHLAGRGVRPLLVDWQAPGAAEAPLSVGGYVIARLRPLLDAIGEPLDLVGYCLGGTMALAAASHPLVRRVATIAAPWDFAGYPAARRQALSAYWQGIAPSLPALRGMPMDLIQPAFWSLDAAGAVAKYERFAALDPDSEAARLFIALEDWANTGAPLTIPAARECFEDFFGANVPIEGGWRVGGETIGPPVKPTLNIVSRTDRLVPAITVEPFGETRLIDAGHVGMMVGSNARAQLWQPLADWLTG
ncbi:alpha/beta fold hydrolase [Sphingosinicella soli]|uniref:Polyhydroxyalkanoate synthase n=1 Tax=Sphingosinicella soli TaxID=333708 RepID=A0A7W7AZU1_9SPHN|nr:alpha/beta fold hydrolase [Sphingosinicella soli]MBB4631404.1 polyhydroxyalkanoate synthase [Sphingosinicella soli]